MARKLAPYVRGADFRQDRPEQGFFDTLGAGISSGLDRTRIGLLNRWSGYDRLGTRIDREQFDQLYGGLGLEYDPHMTRQEIRATLDARRDARAEAELLEWATFGGKAGYLVGNLIGGIPDPLNLIGLGEGMMALNLGRAFLKGAAVNTALEIPFSASEYLLHERQQMPMGAGDVAMNFAMAAGLGGLFGSIGHGINRLTERSRAFNIGLALDENGKVVDVEPRPPPMEPRTESIRESIAHGERIDQDIVEVQLPGRGKTLARLDESGEAVPLRDEAYLANARGGIKTKEEVLPDGTRRVFDPETGEIFREVREFTPQKVRDENREIAAKLREELAELKKANPDKPWSRTDKKTGRKTTGTREGLSLYRLDQLVDGKLREVAQKRTRSERLDLEHEPEGVLVARTSKGARGELKEMGLRDWWRRTLSRAAIKRRDVRRFRKGNIVERRVLGRMGVLKRNQFDWVVDHVAQMWMLRAIASDAKIRVNPEATRRELGDLIWNHLRGNDPWNRLPDLPKRKQSTPSFTPAVTPEETVDDLNAELLAERIRELYAIREKLSPDEYVDREVRGDPVTAETLRDRLKSRTTRMTRDELARRSPEVAALFQRADTYKHRRQALGEAFVCLLGGPRK
jgi:hypothetical protein